MKHSEISIELFKEKCLDVFNKKSTPARIAALALNGYEIVNQLQLTRLEAAQDAIKIILGADCDIDRLRELAQADQEGRVIVLPAKLVYEIQNVPGPDCNNICPLKIDGEPCCDFCDFGIERVTKVLCREEHIEKIGKTVFLTWEEANGYQEKGGIPNGNPEE